MKKHKIPMRTCVISREAYPKNELLRIVANNEGEVFVDTTGKMNGRGAYIKLSTKNIEIARKKRQIDKSLKTEVPQEIYDQLERLCDE